MYFCRPGLDTALLPGSFKQTIRGETPVGVSPLCCSLGLCVIV